jgi:multidrug resistance efflux pump
LTTNNQRLEEALKKAKASVAQAVPAAGGRKIVQVKEQVNQDPEEVTKLRESLSMAQLELEKLRAI